MPQTITFDAADLDQAPALPPPAASAGTRFVEGAWQNLNPMNLLSAAAHPVATLGHLIDAHLDQFAKAKQLYDEGRYVEAAGHLGAGALPLVGPAAAQAGETIASGDIAGGLGQATGVLAGVEAPRLVGATGRAVAPAAARMAAAVPGLGVDAIGLASPRAAHAINMARRLAEAVRNRTPEPGPDPAPPPVPSPEPAPPPRPAPVRASELTPDEIFARVRAAQQARQAAPVAESPAPPPRTGPPTPGSVTPPTPLTSLAELASPGASPPVAPALPAAAAPPESVPTPPPPSATWSPQRLANEVGLAARRAKLKLSADQYQAAEALVRQGQTPSEAVAAVAPPKVKIAAAEMKLYTDLRRRGMSHQEAATVIQTQRELAARLGTPTSEAVRQSVAERNATGRWPE